MKLIDVVKRGWNFLSNGDIPSFENLGSSTARPNYKLLPTIVKRSTIATTIFNRIAIDVSMVNISHIKVDYKTMNEDIVFSEIHNCLNVEANLDQSSIMFMHDLVYSLFDEESGVVAVVPTVTDKKPVTPGGYDILELRVAKITKWYPRAVEVEVYDITSGKKVKKIFQKNLIAIIENPFRDVLSSENSTLKRLIDKLSLIDYSDKEVMSSKLNLILQTPFELKHEAKRGMVQKRLDDIQDQLQNSKYGIAYISSSEKITQLNRPLAPQLFDQIKELTQELYNQLGLTKSVFEGNASEMELRNYYSRTIDTILNIIVSEFRRKFLTKTARTQGHDFVYRRDPMKLMPIDQMASSIDTYLRNAIMTPNEARKLLGLPADPNPRSDELFNRNIADVNQNGNPQQMGMPGDPIMSEQPDDGGFKDVEGMSDDELDKYIEEVMNDPEALKELEAELLKEDEVKKKNSGGTK